MNIHALDLIHHIKIWTSVKATLTTLNNLRRVTDTGIVMGYLVSDIRGARVQVVSEGK